MKLSQTRIECEIDLDAPGKHEGYLRIPHSVHRSAYGWLPMPVVSIRNREGPRVLLMSGNHGDEYEGQVTLTRLGRGLSPEQVNGHVLILPMANYPAAHAGRRTSPVDEGNLNRHFPGDPGGSITAMIAHLIEEELLPHFDLLVDLHSGGSSLLYLPATQSMLQPDGTLDPRLRALIEAYSAPHHHVFGQVGPRSNQSGGAALRKGKLYLTAEFAGAGTVSPEALRICESGLARALHAFGVLSALPAGTAPASAPPRYLELRGDEHYVFAYEDGLHEPLVELGDEVLAGDPAGALHFPETPWREPVVARFKAPGVVVCKRVPGRAQRGDCLFHLAADWPG